MEFNMNNLIFKNIKQPINNSTQPSKLKIFANNTLNSLYEIEQFLSNFHQLNTYLKIYKMFKIIK